MLIPSTSAFYFLNKVGTIGIFYSSVGKLSCMNAPDHGFVTAFVIKGNNNKK